MKPDIKILKLLVEKKEEKLTIKKIAEALKINYRTAYDVITLLEKENLIQLTRAGNAKICSFNPRYHSKIVETEEIRKQELLKNKNITVMYDVLMKLHSKFYILLVFGSYVKNRQTKHSDIDLMFIVPDQAEEHMEKEMQSLVNTLPLNIHLNTFKESDFKAMKNSKESTVGSEAIKSNIILHGVEAYYRMIA